MWRLASLLFGSARLGVAAVLVFLCWQDRPAALASLQFAGLPDQDFAAQARELAGQQRYSEALLVIDAGLDGADPAKAARLQALRGEVEAARDRMLRRVGDVARGALTGRGDSAESLAGAVAADLFVFGDVRDLVIQGGQALRGEEADEVIVALSAAGILLSAAPQLDLGTALLKFARRAGALSRRFAGALLDVARRALREGRTAPLTAVAADASTLARAARPAGALTILRVVDDADDLRRAASLARQPGGAYAAWQTGRAGLDWLEASGPAGEAILIRAARKGAAGTRFLASKGALLLQAHPLLGVVKTLYKGSLPALVQRLLEPRTRQWLLIAALLWLVIEAFLMAARLAPRRR